MSSQRRLEFASFSDLREELQRLLRSGYRPAGKWNLAQIARHLECWARYPMEGFPRAPLPIAVLMKVLQLLIGRRSLRSMLESGRMKSGLPTAPDSVFQPGTEADETAVALYLRTIEKMEKFQGPVHPSPLLGAMSVEQFHRTQLIHAAHHLAFLHPAE